LAPLLSSDFVWGDISCRVGGANRNSGEYCSNGQQYKNYGRDHHRESGGVFGD
jgi:hypothetical protein